MKHPVANPSSAVGNSAGAQPTQSLTPARVLVIGREPVTEGSSSEHSKTVAEFDRTSRAGQFSHYYFAIRAMTGTPSVWFLSPYASFAEMGNAIKEIECELLKNESKHAAVTRAMSSTWIALYRADLSYQPQEMDLGKNRFLRVRVYQVRSGRSYQAVTEGKSLVAAYEKASVDTAFVCYEVVSGGVPGTLIFFEGMRSLAKLDSMNETWRAVTNALGAEKINRIEESMDRVYSSIEDILFAVRPEISRVPKETMEGDPAFWNAQAVTPD